MKSVKSNRIQFFINWVYFVIDLLLLGGVLSTGIGIQKNAFIKYEHRKWLAALKARVQGSNPGGVGWIAVLGKLLTDHASVASAV